MSYECNLPEQFNAADYFVDGNIRKGRGDKVAVICQDRQFTYEQIRIGMNQVGNALAGSGIKMEDRVALMLLDTEIYPQAFFGAIKTGAVPICLNTLMRPNDYTYYLNDSRARLLMVDASLMTLVQGIRSDLRYLEKIIVVNGGAQGDGLAFNDFIDGQSGEMKAADTGPDDACFWLYSSGSTGQPKGTVHLQHDMVFAADTYGKQVLKVKEDDVCFSAAKLFFAYGLGNGLYFPFSVGATAVYMPEWPSPKLVYDTIARHQPTIFFGVPTLFGAMLALKKGDLGRVHTCVSAGEALPADIMNRWKKRFGVQILDGIGTTEICHIFISICRNDVRGGCTGKLVPGYEARIVDENFRDVKDGEIGTLLIKGDSIASCYWNKHDKTKQTMLGEWINTDDKFFKDKDGYFFYVGRSNDMLKVGGIWVSPIEVEACLIEHEAVRECAVVGWPDEGNLIKPKAFVVLNAGIVGSAALEKELKDHVKKALAHYKYPRWIQFVDELPKTATGKIKRFELAKQAS
jgi:4-hydroxybenzoate-CoA ligase